VKIYISGPMTGLPDLNFPAFHAEAARIRALGHEVVNPAELNPDGGTWQECMRKDIAALCECDGIFMLPGWDVSRGALLEFEIASRLGIEAFNHANDIAPLEPDQPEKPADLDYCNAPKYINPKCDLCNGSGSYQNRHCDGIPF
jgi:hypothetical protein